VSSARRLLFSIVEINEVGGSNRKWKINSKSRDIVEIKEGKPDVADNDR